MVRAYSPTISSFYTKRSGTPPQRPRRWDSGSHSTFVTGNAMSEYAKIKLIKSWVLNRSDNITSYTCLKSGLVQVIINKFTLIFILIAVHLKLHGSFVIYNLESLESVAGIRCTSGDAQSLVSSSYDLMRSYQAISANVTLINVKQSVESQMDTLLAGYQSVLSTGVQSAVNASSNSSETIHDWVDQKLRNANLQTSKQINKLQNSLSDLETALNGSSLISTDGLGSASKISLDAYNFEVSEALPGQLTAGKSSLNNIINALAATNAQFKEYLDTNFSSFLSDVDRRAQEKKSNTSSDNFCDQSTDIYTRLVNDADSTTKNGIIAYAILAVLVVIPVAYCEYLGWHYKLQIANKLGEYGEGVYDALEYTSKMESPVLNMLLSALPSEKFDIDPNDAVVCRWWLSFVFSRACQFLLGLVIALMLSYFGQMGIFNGLESVILHSSVPSSTVQDIPHYTGSDFMDIFGKAATSAASILSAYQKSLERTTNNALYSAGLPSTSMQPLQAMSFVSAFMNIRPDNTTLNATQYVQNDDGISLLMNQLSYISTTFLEVALVLLGVWILMVFGACHYVAYRHFKHTKR